MKRPLTLFIVMSMLASASHLFAVNTDYKRTVERLFPACLEDKSEEDPDVRAKLRLSNFVELNFGDTPRLVAGYTNGFVGAVALIDPTEPAKTLDRLVHTGMAGAGVSVGLVQLTPDSDKEVVVNFVTQRGDEMSWPLEVTAESLRLIGPYETLNESRFSALRNADFIDVNGDGISEVITPGAISGGDSGPSEWILYSIAKDGSFSAMTLGHFEHFYRKQGKPQVERSTFATVPAGATLVMVNGFDDNPPSTAGWVKLNGKIAFTPADFQRKQRLTRTSVHLQSQNEIEVELSGDSGSGILLFLEPGAE